MKLAERLAEWAKGQILRNDAQNTAELTHQGSPHIWSNQEDRKSRDCH
jgi:hypothetical protein